MPKSTANNTNNNKRKSMTRKAPSNKTTELSQKPKHFQSEATKALIQDRLKLTLLIILGTFAILLFICLMTYNKNDPSWSHYQSLHKVHNAIGTIGAYTADIILSIFGFFGFLLPLFIIYTIWLMIVENYQINPTKQKNHHFFLSLLHFIGIIFTIAAGSTLSAILLTRYSYLVPQNAGGILGTLLSQSGIVYLNVTGTILLSIACFALGLTLFSGSVWISSIYQSCHTFIQFCCRCWLRLKLKFKRNSKPNTTTFSKPFTKITTTTTTKNPEKSQQPINPDLKISTPPKTKNLPKIIHDGSLPSLELLADPELIENHVPQTTLNEIAQLIERKLSEFNIEVHVAEIHPGPVITRYEVELAPGLKASKISALSQDLARSLALTRVRVVEVVPGKHYVGIEIPNISREIVRLKEILSDDQFQKSKSPLTIALGKDIGGKPQITHLGKMPHLLVAGTTGSGKSVGVNAMIISMLYKASPEDLRLIMIDPKMLELSIYEGIPHLLTPVVTDMKEASNALRWCVKEMDRRYALMSQVGVRNIAGLNDKITKNSDTETPFKDPLWIKQHPLEDPSLAPNLEKLPYIVVIADEFADMMMVVGKKVEELIARLAQKARAAGIHLILATQRPSVDVVTGLIKANIPTRIAFQVSSKIDSRTILDQQGAEQLLGHGDMLYMPPGITIPTRIHGAFVADEEVHNVVNAWKKMGEPSYIESITQSNGAEDDNSDSDTSQNLETQDPLYDEAVQIVIETQRASISGIQRRLRIGYNRSARLIEAMEAAGLVSQANSSGAREVLVSNSTQK